MSFFNYLINLIGDFNFFCLQRAKVSIFYCEEEDWSLLLRMEEEYIEELCMQILKFKPDLVITEKGLSEFAWHFLSNHGLTAIRRLRKTDNNRIAKACGAVIVNKADELQESDVVTGAGLFEVKKIGDEYFAFSHGYRASSNRTRRAPIRL